MNRAGFPFSRRSRGALGLALALAASASANPLRWVQLNPPAGVTEGSSAELTAEVANAGDEPWGEAHFLVVRDSSGQALAVADLAGTEPGRSARRTLSFTPPAGGATRTVYVQALEQDVDWFGEVRVISFSVGPRPPYRGMQLSDTTFDALAPARLSTTDPVAGMAPYRLRAKFIDGSRWGWHAANLWNRNGAPLDNPPPPGHYPVGALYWVRYHSLTGAVLEVGPERSVAVTVAGSVSLSSHWFHASQPPRLLSNESWGNSPYRLFATFRDELGNVWETSAGPNNQGQPLTHLPPPGSYRVTLQWKKYDAAFRVVATGPERVADVTVVDGPQPLLQAAGTISGEPVWDDVLGDWGAELSVSTHGVSVPAAGMLRVRVGASAGAEALLNLLSGDGTPLRSGSGGLELPVSPGNLLLTVTADRETEYAALAELFPYATAPRLGGPESLNARVQRALAVTAVTAAGATPIIFGAPAPGEPNGLPPGLRLDTSSGVLSGIPAVPGTFRVWISARNAAGSTGRWLVITIAPRYAPAIDWRGAEGPESGVLLVDWASSLNAKLRAPAVGLPPPTGTVTYSAVRVPPGGGPPQPLGVPAELPAVITAFTGEIRVTARYPGDADYEPAEATASFVVPDRSPPVAPVSLGFQLTAAGRTGFGVAWQPFSDAAGAAGGRPTSGITYEVELDLGARRLVTSVPAAAFNDLAPGSSHVVRVRARDAAGNSGSWHSESFSIALPVADPLPGTTPAWADVNGDGLADELIPPGPGFAWFAAEEEEEWVSFKEWTWRRVPEIGVSWEDGWNLFVGGGWQQVPHEASYSVRLIRPGFQFLAEPGWDYTVTWHADPPPPGAGSRRVAVFPAAEFTPPGPADARRIVEMIAADFWPAAALHAFPLHLVRLGRPLATAGWRGRTAALGASRGGGGSLLAALGAAGGLRIDLTDVAGQALRLGPRVIWEIWDGLVRIATGAASGPSLELGLTAPGRFQLGLRLDDSTTLWCQLEVARAPEGTLRGPERIWINDDDDSGVTGGDDIPAASWPDFADTGDVPGRIDGVRDLVDFFPFTLQLRELVAAYPPTGGFTYRLAQADGAVNFAYTSLTVDEAEAPQRRVFTTGFGDGFTQPPGEAATRRVPPEGIPLARPFLELAGRPAGAVLLVEGRAETRQPVRLVISDNRGEVVAQLEAPLRVVPVERMYRRLNLRSAARNYDGSAYLPADLGPATALGDPGDAWPDSLTNGRYLVWVHGYSIDGDEARGWSAELFKRLHRAGSRARLVAVAWPGDTGLDYHQAVFHAFQSGDALAPALAAGGVSGDVTVLAHSLGNVVASHAIVQGGLKSALYVMLNAAVPAEAYDGGPASRPRQQAPTMTQADWKALPESFYAATWHALFASTSGDARAGLTWRNRFAGALGSARNYFSPGEEILAAPDFSSVSLLGVLVRQGFGVTRGAWAMQEFAKGASLLETPAALAFSRRQAGWGASATHWPGVASSPDLRTQPYFAPFLEGDLLHRDPARASAAASRLLVQYDVLARALPALSFGAALQALDPLGPGLGGAPERNVNLELIGRIPGVWPDDIRGGDSRNRGRWLHSDFRAVALPYVYPFYAHLLTQARLHP